MPFALTRHLARLGASAAGLGLPAPDLDQVRAGIAALLDAAGRPARGPDADHLTGGESPLGSARGGGPATVIVALGEWPVIEAACDVVVVPWTRNEHGALAGLKTTSYAENVLALGYRPGARRRRGDLR